MKMLQTKCMVGICENRMKVTRKVSEPNRPLPRPPARPPSSLPPPSATNRARPTRPRAPQHIRDILAEEWCGVFEGTVQECLDGPRLGCGRTPPPLLPPFPNAPRTTLLPPQSRVVSRR